MKKLLALVLALVMTLGLATVGANAAISDLKDVDAIKSGDYEEAITVVNAVEVMIGDENGNFNPSNKLTRAEGAAIAARLIATNKVAAALVGNGQKFTDVPANFWDGNGSGMIEYCAANGILNGVGDGKFLPNEPLSAVAFAKMMLTALGYDSQIEGFVNNSDWATKVMTRAQRIDLFEGVEKVMPTDQLTREQAAQMVFNTLKSAIVEYDQKLYTNNGDVLVGSTNAKPVTNEERGKQTIYANRVNAQQNANGAFVVEFAEEYYPALVLSADTDDFGRPANNWTYGRDQLGTWTDESLFVTEWTTLIDGDTVYNAMGALAYKDYDKEIWVNGVELTANTNPTLKSIVDLIVKGGDDLDTITGQGALSQLYVDDANSYARLVVINTYLAEVLTDYNATGKSISLGVYETQDDTQVARTASLTDDNAIADLKIGDMVLVTEVKPGTNSAKVMSVKTAEVNENAYINLYKSSDGKMSQIQIDGTDSKVSCKALWNSDILKNYTLEQLKGFTYDVWYDTYDNVIGIDFHTTNTNYVFVVGVETKSSYLAYTTYTANLIFMDGTMKTVTVTANKNGSALTVLKALGTGSPVVNAWFTYSTDDAGNIILNDVVPTELTANQKGYQSASTVANVANVSEINASATTLDATGTAPAAAGRFAYGNDKSIYITVDVDRTGTYGIGAATGVGAIKEVTGVSTGIKNTSIEVAQVNTLSNFNGANLTGSVLTAPALAAALGVAGNSKNAYFMYDSKGYVVAAIVIGADAGAARNFVYVISGPTQRQYNGRYLDTYKVIKDGEITTMDVDSQKSGTTTAKLGTQRLHQVAFDQDNIVIDLKSPVAGLGETKNNTINTATNKTNGYTYNIIGAATAAANDTVTIDGNTLKVANGNNVSYVLVGDGCKFFVRNPASGAYDIATSAKGALAMAKQMDGNKQRLIQSISSVVDGSTGFAKTLIFYVTYTATAVTSNSVSVVNNAAKGLYQNAQFYTPDNHAITWTEAKNALTAQMQNDGCTNIVWTAANIVEFTFNGAKLTQTINSLSAAGTVNTVAAAPAIIGQVYKVTYLATATAAPVTKYLTNGTAAATVLATVGGTAIGTAKHDNTGVIESVGALPGVGTMPAYDITITEAGANVVASLQTAINANKGGSVTLDSNVISDGAALDIPENTTLKIAAGRTLTVGALTVEGTITGVNDTDVFTVNTANATFDGGKFAAGSASLAGTGANTLTLKNGADIDAWSVTGYGTIIVGCTLKVNNELDDVANLVLVGGSEASKVDLSAVTAANLNASITAGTIANVYMGFNTASATDVAKNNSGSTLVMPKIATGAATLTTLTVAGTAEVDNDATIGTLKMKANAEVDLVPEAAASATDGVKVTTIECIDDGKVTVKSSKDIVITDYKVDTATPTSTSISVPVNTKVAVGGAAFDDTSKNAGSAGTLAAGDVTSSSSPLTEVTVTITSQNASSATNSVYVNNGDTLTITFSQKVELTATRTASLGTTTVVGQSIVYTVGAAGTDTFTIKAVPADPTTQQGKEQTITITIPTLTTGKISGLKASVN